jgi:hypothetical protein
MVFENTEQFASTEFTVHTDAYVRCDVDAYFSEPFTLNGNMDILGQGVFGSGTDLIIDTNSKLTLWVPYI